MFISWLLMLFTGPQYMVCEQQTYVEVAGFPEDSLANEIATYTYNKYWMDILLLLKAENGTFEPNRKHNSSYKKCVKWYDENRQRRIPAKRDAENKKCYGQLKTFNDWWLCGISEYRHPELVYNPSFTDRHRQVDKCAELKQGWTAFYWWKSRNKYKNQFTILQKEVCHLTSYLEKQSTYLWMSWLNYPTH